MKTQPADSREPPSEANEHPAVRDIRELFRTELLAKAPHWENMGSVPREVFETLGSAGVFRARWSDETAPGLGNLEVGATIVRESAIVSPGGGIAIGAHLDPFLSSLRACEYGNATLEAALDGSVIGSIGLSEPTSGSDVAHCNTTARRVAGGWEVTGTKQYVSNLGTADDCVVLARTPADNGQDPYSLLVVPVRAEGVTQQPHEMAGARASGTAIARFDHVRIGDDRLVGEIGTGLTRAEKMLRVERMWAAVGGAVIAELALELALAFTTARRIRGKALRRHQAVSHRLADLSTHVEAAHAVADRQLEAARTGTLTAASAARAKLFNAHVAYRAADEAMQLLGGCGYTEETAVARLWRDARVGRIGGGTDELLRELISRGLRRGRLSDLPDVADARRQGGRGREPSEANL